MQLSLDFSKRLPVPEKKLSDINFKASEEYKDFLTLFAKVLNTSRSELCHRYVLEGMQRELANIFMAQPHMDKTLKTILSKNF